MMRNSLDRELGDENFGPNSAMAKLPTCPLTENLISHSCRFWGFISFLFLFLIKRVWECSRSGSI